MVCFEIFKIFYNLMKFISFKCFFYYFIIIYNVNYFFEIRIKVRIKI